MVKIKKQNLSVPWNLVITFLVLAVVLCIGGFYLYSIQKQKIKDEIYSQLTIIAKLKVKQIENWRNGILDDAKAIQNNLSFVNDINNWLKNEKDLLLKTRIENTLESLCKDDNFSNVYLFDLKFNSKIKVKINEEMDPGSIASLERMKNSPFIQLTDLHKSPFSNDIHMNLLIPLMIHEKNNDKLIAIINLRVEPGKFLFPLIQEWPTDSKTAETILVRKTGNSVIFINELRHKKNTALSYTIPLTDTLKPAVKAVRAFSGITEGVDYRGVEVLADLHKIEKSNWFMVAKVDVDEVMAPLTQTALRITGTVALLVILLGVVLITIWRNQRADFYKQKYQLEIEKKVLQTHFEYLIKHANDIILLINKDGKIVDANEKAILTYGYTKQELLGLSISNIRDDRINHYKASRENLKTGVIFETVHLKKDLSKIPVEVSSRLIEMDGNEFYQNIIRDITERKQAEEKIEHLNTMYAFLSQVNQSIVRVKNAGELFNEVCSVAIKFGKFNLAWIGTVNHDEKNVIPFTASNTGIELISTKITMDVNDYNLVTKAVNTKQIFVCNNTGQYPTLVNNLMYKLPQEYRSIAVLPVLFKGQVISVFVLYTTAQNYFIEEQIKLLEEIGMDISYALENFEEAEKRRLAEESLESEKNLLRTIIEYMPALFYFKDTQARYVINNRAHLNSLGLNNQEDTIGKTIFDVHPKEFVQQYHADEDRLLNTGQTVNKEEIVYYPNTKEYRWHSCIMVPVKDAHDKMIGFVGLSQDITERKKSELALKESEEFNKSLLKTIPFGMNIVDESGEILFANENFERYSTGNALGKKCWEVYKDDRTQCKDCPLKSQIEIGATSISESSEMLNGKVFLITHTGMMFKGKKAILEIFQDITERKLIEIKLRENQKLLSTVIENMPVGVFLTDSHGSILHGNSAAQKIWEGIRYVGTEKYNQYKAWFVKSGQKLGQHDWPVIRVLETGHSILNEEIEIETFNGMHKFINNSAVPIFGSNKEITGAVIVNEDITERKQAEEALLYEHNLVKALMDHSTDHIYFKDKHSRFIKLNKEQAASFSLDDPDYAIGKSDFDFFTEEHARAAYEDEQDIINSRVMVISKEEKETWPDGRETWVSTIKLPLRDKNNVMIGTFGISRDITISKIAEKALRDSEEKFRNFAEESPNIIYIHKDGNFVYVNQKCVDLLGYSREEFYNHSFNIFRHLVEQINYEMYKKIYFDAFTRQEQKAHEVTLLTKDKRKINAIHTIKVIEYDGGKALMGTVTDITERKKMENELMRAKEKAETANKLKSEFLAQMSHEIRSPLNVTLSFVNLIKDEVGSNIPPNLIQYFDGVDSAGKRLIRTVDLILNMSEMQIGLYEPNWMLFDLAGEILNQLYLEYKGQAKQKCLEFSLINKASDSIIYGDKYSVNQIFANLIDNAIKYTEQGKIEITVENDSQRNLIAKVKDSGIGISDSFMHNMFELFMQEDRGYSRRYEGNGLGLALVKKYCDLNKAVINVESTKGIGSTFIIKFSKPIEV